MESEQNCDDDNNFRHAFGEHTGISSRCREEIDRTKSNDPDLTALSLYLSDVGQFSDLALELLGGYIAKNEHLKDIDLEACGLTDAKMSLLFRNWTMGRSLSRLDLEGNEFGVDGVRSMVPFLNNARNLITLHMNNNDNINTACFILMVEALHAAGGSIEELILNQCNIDDITALEHYLLPRLTSLDLDHNNVQSMPSSLENYLKLEQLWLEGSSIGREGFKMIAKLLQNDGSFLKSLDLRSNNMDDLDAETLVNSLKCNTMMREFYLEGSNVTEKILSAFSKLLNDISSIERTYNSNHNLIHLNLTDSTDATIKKITRHINQAIRINKNNEGNSHAAGRAKVIETQLNSKKRKELPQLPYESIFAEIEPFFCQKFLPWWVKSMVRMKCIKCYSQLRQI